MSDTTIVHTSPVISGIRAGDSVTSFGADDLDCEYVVWGCYSRAGRKFHT